MATKVLVPRTGYSSVDAVIGQWLKSEGDTVSEGEVIAVAEAEKTSVEITAPASGILKKILAPVGASVPIGHPIAIIAEGDEDITELLGAIEVKGSGDESAGAAGQGSLDQSESSGHAPRVSESHEIKATPAARKVAHAYNVDLSRITGHGPGGRITEEDVLVYVKEGASGEVLPSNKVSTGLFERPGDKVIPLSAMRKFIAEQMVKSKHTAAHVTTATEVDLTDLMSVRRTVAGQGAASGGRPVSITACVVKAAAKALQEYPIVNSSFTGEEIILRGSINVGIAVALDSGLVVAVVRDANQKDVFTITTEVAALAEKARAGRLTAQDISDGTFTVSNAGMYDVTVFTPIIRQPESAILGVGTVADRPSVVNGQIEVRKLANLCLSYDHRVFDGSVAASFLKRVKLFLQEPISLFLE